ncbi:hypothetical protein P879_02494 [Paragonimus westermani]|uniref:Histone-binding protein RBBP4-like N-terminal domain-containing protein n=1 Tax=Paragonimus westermani TaxID=34504 RepID=A0A8T0DRF1_9TREM|nr:hypothetical protein P879_02494 [Paragonimus westermani]
MSGSLGNSGDKNPSRNGTSPPNLRKKKKLKGFKADMCGDEMEIDDAEDHEHVQPVAYIPGRSRPLMEDEQLVMDKSSYRMYYEFQVESASLSFDILLDNLGSDREVEVNGQPATACLVAGTQAPRDVNNNLVVVRLTNMRPFIRKNSDDEGVTHSDSEDDTSDEDEDLDAQPELEAATVQHMGAVNRVRAHRHGGRYLAAAWSELARVSVWDLTRPLTAVNDSAVMSEYVRHGESPTPLYTHKGHKTEGFALDWSPHCGATGHLASGDCNGVIYHWTPRPTDWALGRTPYTGHTGSVEDIQWSPTEPTVFISVSADHSIRVWDTRSPPTSGSMLTVLDAHPSDINVASWNRLQPVSLLTGGDDGSLRIWDLRLVNKRYGASAPASDLPAYTHLYNYHTKPITSVEWHPSDAGVFVACAEDDQTTIWDNTLEQADEEITALAENDKTSNLPVQLLFIHCGQTEVKEAHWHPQIPGLLFVTALNGFNVFRTCNV